MTIIGGAASELRPGSRESSRRNTLSGNANLRRQWRLRNDQNQAFASRPSAQAPGRAAGTKNLSGRDDESQAVGESESAQTGQFRLSSSPMVSIGDSNDENHQ